MINGARLKQLRLKNGYTLTKLSEEIGCTASFLSQIERGLKEPSLAMLRKLSNSFSEPIFYLLSPDNDASPENTTSYSIVRAKERLPLTTPSLSIKSEAITTTEDQNSSHRMRGVIYKMAPGSYASEGLISHKFDECTYVLSGQIEIHFSDNIELLEAGDCIYIRELTIHNFKNCGDSDAILLAFSN